MKHLFVNYETALKLKELGFNEECLAWYNGKNIERYTAPNFRGIKNFPFRLCPTAPLYQQVIDWLREKHDLTIEVDKQFDANGYASFISNNYEAICIVNGVYYDVLGKAIEEALKLIENGKN